MDHTKMRLHLFWHMHQPSYIRGDEITMPWVFLHAIKDYFDMPYLVEKTGAKATFNLSATLIEQIHIYETAPHKDKFLNLWRKDPSDLSQDDKQYLLKIMKSINSNLILCNDLRELLRFDILDDKQFVNLEVLFLLSWCGRYLQEELASFMDKKGFFQSDKEFLFDKLMDFMKTILPYYEKLAKEGRISLFTTPYAHPILPLLLDTDNAKRANPATLLPKNPIDLSDDALKQIIKAKAIYKETFGMEPDGFWPAEGSVDAQSVKLYGENGIKYIASDEEILHRSGEMNHYLPYSKDGVIIFFRDHSLSDLIGFKYKAIKADTAVTNFIASLPNVKPEEVVSVILDGENAWEFYLDGGYGFLEKLYRALALKVTLIKAEDIKLKECKRLQRLQAGSWIHGDFSTWIGDHEKNLAWEYLFKTKDAYNKSGIKSKKIEEKFLLAECSDWFWWYGEGHYTDFALEFDELFRKHLIDIYKLMDQEPPSWLILPIVKEKGTQNRLEPKNYITPIMDGRFSSIFEWHGAGVVFENKLYSTMEMKRVVEKLYFGNDQDAIYFAIIGDIEHIDNFTITIEEEKRDFQVNKRFKDALIEVVSNSIIEIKIDAKITKLDVFHVRFNFDTQIVPLNGGVCIDKNNNFSDNWFI